MTQAIQAGTTTITADDLDELIASAEAAGDSNTAELREAHSAMAANGRSGGIASGIKKKILIMALRYGGKILVGFLRTIGMQAAAEWIDHHRVRLADELEQLSGWAEAKIAELIRGLGAPDAVATAVAKAIMAFIG